MVPVRKRQVLSHGHSDDIPASVSGGLLNGGDDLFGLPNTNPHITLLVAHHHNRPKMQLFPSLDHLGDPPDLNHPFLKPISHLLLLGLPQPSRHLHLRVHHVHVVSQQAHTAVGWAVQILVRSRNFVLCLHWTVVEGRGFHEVLGTFWWIECNVVFGVDIVEEGGIDVRRSGLERRQFGGV